MRRYENEESLDYDPLNFQHNDKEDRNNKRNTFKIMSLFDDRDIMTSVLNVSTVFYTFRITIEDIRIKYVSRVTFFLCIWYTICLRQIWLLELLQTTKK